MPLKYQTPLHAPFVPFTYADERFITPGGYATNYLYANSLPPKLLMWWARNCDALAYVMDRVPVENHKQSTFGTCDPICGTSACAGGWAALSHCIPGLQYWYNDAYIKPLVNGVKFHIWANVLEAFFGAHHSYRHGQIFGASPSSPPEKARELRGLAREHRRNAKRPSRLAQ